MGQKKIGMSIDEELNNRWGEVAKKHGLAKSGMVEEYLRTILPILEAETPNKMMAKAMKKMGEEIDLTANLFDREYEYTDKDWEEQYKELQERKKD